MDLGFVLKGLALWVGIILLKGIFSIAISFLPDNGHTPSHEERIRLMFSDFGFIVLLCGLYIGHEIRQLRAAVLEARKL